MVAESNIPAKMYEDVYKKPNGPAKMYEDVYKKPNGSAKMYEDVEKKDGGRRPGMPFDNDSLCYLEVRLAQPPKKEVGELIRKAHQELKFPIGQGFTDALKEYHQMNAPEE